jgi:hypothetical protein
MRTTRLLLALVATSFVFAAVPAGSSAATFEVGIQDDPVLVFQKWYDRTKAIAQARQLGVTTARVNIIWGQFVDYGRKFDVYDSAVNALLAQGIKPQITIMGSPDYLVGSQEVGYFRPDPQRYADFATLVANHYKGKVFRYAIWNEPNLSRYLSPNNEAPRLYYRLFKAGYAALKRVDPKNYVLFGELTSPRNVDPLKFLRRVVAFGRVRTDGFALHAFQFHGLPPTKADPRWPGGIGNTPAIKRLMRKLARDKRFLTPRGGPVPLHYTEFSYQTYGYMAMSEQQRAQYATNAFRFARRWGVRQLLWYQLMKAPSEFQPKEQPWDSGIVNLDGCITPSFSGIAAANLRPAPPACS